ncbi:ATP-dependent helicase HrpB [Stella humosa]|uniref:ATP-dependent helicase HrpB n=1 Tax=Stella humosa TaxID=94 RepID=A0A3N1M9N8_9PROT|nr:ATP-dependent helicase HrpB [Stella humosa]ROP99754.1 ATP-dependent helicase HrpB [Stella humosa]BBK31019.1 ATP-dependent helicase HrpB [Stella humosa]
MTDLPIHSVLPAIREALARGRSVVLRAPPGAGKTTAVPPALLDAPWRDGGTILMLEPRRLAARSAARRMAAVLGEEAGATIGYRVRLESRVGPATRIEVVTEGIFLRRIQGDPGLDGVAAVIFDEFHERSVDADLALALTLETRGALRPDLRLVVMSATLDGAPLARLLGDAETIEAEGRMFPVEIRHADRARDDAVEIRAADTARRALAEGPGDVLVFLPGMAEIRRAERHLAERLEGDAVDIEPLHGDLASGDQDRAIAPSRPGRRKIVLATAIAETSLTIEGVRTVVDAGLRRAPRFDPRTGMTRLVTVPVSAAGAEQRRGRAGRLAPGICHRLWTEAEQRGLPAFDLPEIRSADLAPLALELALWGVADPASLSWLDPPPAAALDQARGLLQRLGAVDAAGRPTAIGRRMGRIGVHPRLARMIVGAETPADGWTACRIAALLSERDPLAGRGRTADADLRTRLAGGERGAFSRIHAVARDLARAAGIRAGLEGGHESPGALLALAYPDRVGRRVDPRGLYRLSGGGSAALAEGDPLVIEEWLAVASLDGDRQQARIFLAAPLTRGEIDALFADRIETAARIAWDPRSRSVQARRERRLDRLVLDEGPLPDPDPAAIAAAMLTGVRELGLGILGWTSEAREFQARVALLRRIEGADAWPDLSDAALLQSLEDWLGPHVGRATQPAQLARLDPGRILLDRLDWDARRRLDAAAPTHLTVPTGSRIALAYGQGEQPVLAVRLQEMFGERSTPTICNGRVPVLIHLLSPAGRPVQVTQDLAGFWDRGYRDVRSDLRGRYPRHYWPDDPRQAEPTRRVRPRGT